MKHPLNTSPYTVTFVREHKADWAIFSIMCHGETITTFTDTGTNRADLMVTLLNAAYVKGVENERARVRELADCEPEEMTSSELHHLLGMIGNPDEAVRLDAEATRSRAMDLLVATYNFSLEIAARLVAFGLCSPAAFEGVEVHDLTQDNIFTQVEAEDIMGKVNPPPPIYPITLTHPVMPCWVYHPEKGWKHVTGTFNDDYAFWGFTHYSPDAPNPPAVNPS